MDVENPLNHFNENGEVHMVDVGEKENSFRQAIACGDILMKRETLKLISSGNVSKGDVFGTARLAGIMAAKNTSNLIPLCHPIQLTNISIDLAAQESENKVKITASVKSMGKTGVEMEALTAVNIAALTIYDMVKSADKNMRISNIRLVLKDGGKSGKYEAA